MGKGFVKSTKITYSGEDLDGENFGLFEAHTAYPNSVSLILGFLKFNLVKGEKRGVISFPTGDTLYESSTRKVERIYKLCPACKGEKKIRNPKISWL